MADFGYAGEILKVDLSNGKVTRLPTADYAERFVGGRGIAAKLYWDMVPPETGAFDADNCLICISGPAAGFTGLAGFRWQACSKTAPGEPEAYYEAAAQRFKEKVRVPLMLVGGIRTLETAERLVAESVTDYVSLCRPLIREPGLVNRWRSGDRRPASCISDNRCFVRGLKGRGVRCAFE